MSSARRTLSVLLVTTLTALAVFAAVEVVNVLAPNAVIAATTQTCPATGCTTSTCHATNGTGIPQSGSSSSSATYTCPRTGCTASYCHAAQGGGNGSGGYGAGSGYGQQGQGQGQGDTYNL